MCLTWRVLASWIAILPSWKPNARRLALWEAQSRAVTPVGVENVQSGLLGFLRDQMHTHPFWQGPKAKSPYPTAKMLESTWCQRQNLPSHSQTSLHARSAYVDLTINIIHPLEFSIEPQVGLVDSHLIPRCRGDAQASSQVMRPQPDIVQAVNLDFYSVSMI